MLDRTNSSEEANISQESTDPAIATPIDRVLDAFERFMNRMMSGHAPEFTDIGVTMAQAKVLYILAAADALRMSELAGRLGVSMSTASGAVDRLVDLGLVGRRPEPTDRRQVLVAVTPAGSSVLEAMRELNSRQMRLLLERLEPDELATVERAITVLGAAAARDIPPPTQTSERGPS